MGTLDEQELGYADVAPVQAEATTVVGASPAAVWERLADHRTWPEWFGSGMRTVTPTSTVESGVGCTRQVDLGLMKVDERFIAWDVGQLWAFTGVAMRPKLFTKLVERVVLEPLDGGRTRVTYRMAFELVTPMRPLAPVLKAGMSRALGKALASLGQSVEAQA